MKTFLIAAYEVNRVYGGPEEGGWWFDAGELIRVVKVFRSESKAFDFCRRLNARLHSRKFGPNAGRRDLSSVLSDGEVEARVFEKVAPAFYPEHKPHYE